MFVPNDPMNSIPALVQIMAGLQCINASLCLNELNIEMYGFSDTINKVIYYYEGWLDIIEIRVILQLYITLACLSLYIVISIIR